MEKQSELYERLLEAHANGDVTPWSEALGLSPTEPNDRNILGFDVALLDAQLRTSPLSDSRDVARASARIALEEALVDTEWIAPAVSFLITAMLLSDSRRRPEIAHDFVRLLRVRLSSNDQRRSLRTIKMEVDRLPSATDRAEFFALFLRLFGPGAASDGTRRLGRDQADTETIPRDTLPDDETLFSAGLPGRTEPFPGSKLKTCVSVGFATNRVRREGRFTNDITTDLSHGFCEVTIPENHEPGALERPKKRWYWFDEKEDEREHFVVQRLRITTRESLLRHFDDAVARSVLVYVHGFNVSFEDAALRCAQLHYDLRFPGQSLFFAWASHSAQLGYVDDGTRISDSVDDIRGFLEDVASRLAVGSIYLLGHSMGSRGLARALASMGKELSSRARGKFKELILAEPDISQDSFRMRIVPGLQALGARVTVYASKNDRALGISQKVNNGVPRLGQAGERIYKHKPRWFGRNIDFDMVDASDVGISLLNFNHSTYAENLEFLLEIVGVIDGKPVARRPGVEKRPGQEYWYLFPARA